MYGVIMVGMRELKVFHVGNGHRYFSLKTWQIPHKLSALQYWDKSIIEHSCGPKRGKDSFGGLGLLKVSLGTGCVFYSLTITEEAALLWMGFFGTLPIRFHETPLCHQGYHFLSLRCRLQNEDPFRFQEFWE